MPRESLGQLCRRLRSAIDQQDAREHSDGELLQRFALSRDEAAFATLVQRHGTLVLSVCRNVLRHQQDAEDAFQATFLVLARKAGALRRQGSLASWLHGVSYRTALNARRIAMRRLRHEQQARVATVEPAAATAALQEMQLGWPTMGLK
jgi:DNA-directed RNA polymerase specialized sigma24 family protein